MPGGESYPSSVWCWTLCQSLCYWTQHSVDSICWLIAQEIQPAQNSVYKCEQVYAPHFISEIISISSPSAVMPKCNFGVLFVARECMVLNPCLNMSAVCVLVCGNVCVLSSPFTFQEIPIYAVIFFPWNASVDVDSKLLDYYRGRDKFFEGCVA